MKTLLPILALALAPCSLVQAQTYPAIIFQQTYGGPNGDQLATMLALPDGGFLLGGVGEIEKVLGVFSEDYWLVRIDANGNQQWTRNYGGYERERLKSVVPTPDGGFLLGGDSESMQSPDFSLKSAPKWGAFDYWIVKADAQGNKQWDKSYGGSDGEELSSIVATSDGGYLLAGKSRSSASGNKSTPDVGPWLVKIGRDGNKQWDRTVGPTNVTVTVMVASADGGYVLGGFQQLFKTNGFFDYGDFWAKKIDGNGNNIWERTYGGRDTDILTTVVRASDGGYVLGGLSISPASGDKTSPDIGQGDYWIVRTDANGMKQWDRTYGGTGPEYLYDVLVTSDGGYLLGGYSASVPSGNKTAALRGGTGQDYWILKTDDSGNKQWDQSYGGSSFDVLRKMLATPDGGYLLGGDSSSITDGNKTAPNLGSADFWVLKIAGSVPPSIVRQPESKVVSTGMNVDLQIEAFSFVLPIRYQWRFNGTNLVGATNAILTLTNVQSANAGSYYVVVSNDYGSVESSAGILTYTEAANLILSVHPSLTIFGAVGKTYQIEYSEDAKGPLNWIPLTNIVLNASPQLWVDTQAAMGSQRFYRVLLKP